MFIPDLTYDQRLNIARCMLQYSTSYGNYSYDDIYDVAISLMQVGDYWASANRIDVSIPDDILQDMLRKYY